MNLPQRENTNTKQLYVGYQAVNAVAVNPTKDQLIDLLGITEQETADKFREPEYFKEKDEANEVTLAFYVKNPKTEKVEPIYFTLADKDRISTSGKSQYINQVGEFQWVDDESNLWESFTNFVQVTKWKAPDGNIYEKYKDGAKPAETKSYGEKYYRKALVGEEQLYSFVKAALIGIDYRNADANILFDNKALFKANYKEVQNLIKDDSFGPVVVCYCVKTKEADGGFQEVQRINNKFFLPGGSIKFLRNFQLDKKKLEDLQYKKDAKRKLTSVEAFFVDTTDSENGIKDYWVPVEQTEYDGSKNPLMGEATVVVSNDSSY